MKRAILITILAIAWTASSAQIDRGMLRDGNRQYNKKQYDRAELLYRKALESDSGDFRGHYNLGNALYRQGKNEEAIRHFEQASAAEDISNQQRSRALHNLGNSHATIGIEALKSGDQQGMTHLQQAAKAYREALKIDPKNDDTRYNLAYMMRLIEQAQQQQQQQQQGSNGNNQNKESNRNQDGNNQNGNNDKQQSQNQQQQPADGKDQNDKGQNGQQQQNIKDAERLLEAVKNNERQTMREHNRKVQDSKAKHSEKDW